MKGNIPSSSTSVDICRRFDSSNPATFNSSTSVTIFDSLGNPVIATAYFIKTQAAGGEATTHNYQTKFIVDGREGRTVIDRSYFSNWSNFGC